MYYTVSKLWGSRTNKRLCTYNIVLLALNYQMYNIAKHTYITSFWAVHHSTSMRKNAHIKWNTLGNYNHLFDTLQRDTKGVQQSYWCYFMLWRHTVEPKYAWQGQKSLICCWGVPKKYCSYTFTIPKFSQVAMISLQVSDFSLLDIKACTNDLCKGY